MQSKGPIYRADPISDVAGSSDLAPVPGSPHFRRVLGRYPTGIAMITAQGPDGKPIGMIVGTFSSVSLDPPLISFMPAKTSTTWPLIEESGYFAVNVLSVEQSEVCRSFRGDYESRFAGEPWREGATGSPIMTRSAAWIDCVIDSVVGAGDHFIVLGRVVELNSENANLPLLFFQGGYGSFTPQTMVAIEAEVSENLAFVDRARPIMESLSAATECECVLGALGHDEVLIVASAGTRANSELATLVGERLPLVAPFGRSAMAWASAEQADRWVKGLEEDSRDAFHEMLSIIRQRGYSLTIRADDYPDQPDALSLLDPGIEVVPGTHPASEVRTVTAPVLNEHGETHFILGLYGFDHTTVDSVGEIAQALQSATATLSKHVARNIPTNGEIK